MRNNDTVKALFVPTCQKRYNKSMSEISLKQAYRLLGADPSDSEAELKRKYHQSIRRCHPDADPEHQEKAHLLSQKINGAYQLILDVRKQKPDPNRFRNGRSAAHAYDASRNGFYNKSYGRDPDHPSGKQSSKRGFCNENSKDRYGDRYKRSYEDGYENRYDTPYEDEYDDRSSGRHTHAPRPEENPSAFCPRVLYEGSSFYETFHSGHAAPFEGAFGSLHQNETIYGHMSEGRYFWDPNHESFALFMLSVHRKCQELVHSPEAELRLFHLLLQEYIRPWTCLTKIAAENPEIKSERDGFHIPIEIAVPQAHAAALAEAFASSGSEASTSHAADSADPDSAASDYEVSGFDESGSKTSASRTSSSEANARGSEEELISVRVDHDRIHLITHDRLDLGHITFLQDSLYVVVLPLLTRRCVRTRVRLTSFRGKKRPKNILHFDLFLYDPMPVISDRPANNSLEIMALLRADA